MCIARGVVVLTLLGIMGFPLSAQSAGSGASAPCPDPRSVLTAFYDDNDARSFDTAMGLLADEATIDTWATGVNGYIMAQRHPRGKAEIRKFLENGRGLCRHLPDSPPDGPNYHETNIVVSGNIVRFMLEPDKKRPNGRLYNPFSVEAVLDGCLIKSLTVIERVTWL